MLKKIRSQFHIFLVKGYCEANQVIYCILHDPSSFQPNLIKL